MKRCPQCNRVLSDDALVFCRVDGARLVTDSLPIDFTATAMLPSEARSGEASTLHHQTPSIAVLPFANLSADAENEYFCDGLAEELLNALAKVEGLNVAARTSAFSFKGKQLEISEIGQKLNVNTVLEGSVRKAGNRLRIIVQLINVADGYHLWSERYDRQMEDIFDVQDEITLAVVDALKVKLLGEEKEAVLRRHTDDTVAYQLYLHGRFFWNQRTPEGLSKAISYFEQAVASDVRYALAYSGLADCYNIMAFYEAAPPHELRSRAVTSALKAVELDASLAESHVSLGTSKYMFEWDWLGCVTEHRKAISLNPKYATGHHHYAVALTTLWRFDEAEEQIRLAQELEPLTPIINGFLAVVLYYSRKYDESRDQALRTIELAPQHFFAHWVLGLAYSQKSMYQEALLELEQAIALSGGNAGVKGDLGYVYARNGDTAAAENVLEELERQGRERYISPVNLARVHVGLKNTEMVFEKLEEAYEERAIKLALFTADPANIDCLQPDPRFADLVRRLGLAQ